MAFYLLSHAPVQDDLFKKIDSLKETETATLVAQKLNREPLHSTSACIQDIMYSLSTDFGIKETPQTIVMYMSRLRVALTPV